MRDARLLELARLGDEAAFAELVQRHRSLLLAHCRAIVGESAAQDAVQQAYINAWRALGRGCEVRNARAWLFTIARRSALQLLRARAEPTEELSAELPGAGSPHELLERRTQLRTTLAAVAHLPPHERDALLLTTVYGRSGRDAARALGVTEPQVRQLVFRARGRAREALVGAGALLAGVGLVARRVLRLRRAAASIPRGPRWALGRRAARLSSVHVGAGFGGAALVAAVVVAAPPIVAPGSGARASRSATTAGVQTLGAERQPSVLLARVTKRSRVRARTSRFAPRRGVFGAAQWSTSSRGEPAGPPPAAPAAAATATGAVARSALTATAVPAPRASAVHARGSDAAGKIAAALPQLKPGRLGSAVPSAVTAPVVGAAGSLQPPLAGVVSASEAPSQQAPAILRVATSAAGGPATPPSVTHAMRVGP